MCTEKDRYAEHQLPSNHPTTTPMHSEACLEAVTVHRTAQGVSGPGKGRGISVQGPCQAGSSAQQSEGLM